MKRQPRRTREDTTRVAHTKSAVLRVEEERRRSLGRDLGRPQALGELLNALQILDETISDVFGRIGRKVRELATTSQLYRNYHRNWRKHYNISTPTIQQPVDNQRNNSMRIIYS